MATNYWLTRNVKERERLLESFAGVTDQLIRDRYVETAQSVAKELTDLYNDITVKSISISQLYDYQRYYNVLELLNSKLKSLGESEVNILTGDLARLYQSIYNLTGKQYGWTGLVDESRIKEVLTVDWVGDGKNFSSRIWTNKAKLMDYLQQGLFEAITTGKSSDDFTADIMSRMGVGYNQANRLARTELSHVYNQGALDRYSDAGVMQVRYLAERNSRTCQKCKSLDGTIYMIGNQPELPLHTMCRCT